MLEIPGAMMKGRDRSILYPTQRSAQKIDGLDTDLCRLPIDDSLTLTPSSLD
ncbi:hypothetical protein AB3R30_19985 [Leptolyngbyaceae cyanobacterium UHCC 1019]